MSKPIIPSLVSKDVLTEEQIAYLWCAVKNGKTGLILGEIQEGQKTILQLLEKLSAVESTAYSLSSPDLHDLKSIDFSNADSIIVYNPEENEVFNKILSIPIGNRQATYVNISGSSSISQLLNGGLPDGFQMNNFNFIDFICVQKPDKLDDVTVRSKNKQIIEPLDCQNRNIRYDEIFRRKGKNNYTSDIGKSQIRQYEMNSQDLSDKEWDKLQKERVSEIRHIVRHVNTSSKEKEVLNNFNNSSFSYKY